VPVVAVASAAAAVVAVGSSAAAVVAVGSAAAAVVAVGAAGTVVGVAVSPPQALSTAASNMINTRAILFLRI
jgi:hypothetical protein